MALYINYIKHLTNLGSPPKIKALITSHTAILLNLSSNNLTIKTLYNPLFNTPTIYHGSNYP